MASPVPVWLDAFVLSYPLGFVRPNKILRAFIADWLATIDFWREHKLDHTQTKFLRNLSIGPASKSDFWVVMQQYSVRCRHQINTNHAHHI